MVDGWEVVLLLYYAHILICSSAHKVYDDDRVSCLLRSLVEGETGVPREQIEKSQLPPIPNFPIVPRPLPVPPVGSSSFSSLLHPPPSGTPILSAVRYNHLWKLKLREDIY
jgi:hypothetical protein